MLALSCILLSVYLSPRKDIHLIVIFILLIFLSYIYEYQVQARLATQNTFVYNSPYSRIEVRDSTLISGDRVRNLFVDNITHAGKYLERDELLHEYTKRYDLFSALYPEAKNVVMIGGAAYSYPQHFLRKYPEKSIDVVEIDEQMTEIAKRHF